MTALSIDGLEQIVRAAKTRAGLTQATCHQLRHTCLTRLREAGMALEAIQAQAGHRSIESTRVYLHLADDWLADEYRRAAELIDATAGILRVSAVAALDAEPGRGRCRHRDWEHVVAHAPLLAVTAWALCRSAGRVDASRDRRCRRQHAALLRRVPRHRAPRDRRVRRRAPDPCRRVQAVLRRPPHRQGRAAGTEHDPSTARDVALLLRSDHRVGLARRTDADADLRRRCPRRR